ncbi:chemotaxis protein CheW [Variovorax sp. VNK109]|jgi:purine-binding chemotaxis protein CheW|uniref:chemotaxis protein CheW n=1 Tax=Variovorax sp. VNK109 TaxID=3400919 RepID=UPI003C083296
MSFAILAPHATHSRATPEAGSTARELLTFRLAEEHYGIDILKVQEIRGHEAVTRIANSPAHMVGVINLRGIIVPILDMRTRFGLPPAAQEAPTVVIILNVGSRVVGIVVDSVSDVVRLGADCIRPTPDAALLDAGMITGLGTIEDRMIILLDIDQVVAGMQVH